MVDMFSFKIRYVVKLEQTNADLTMPRPKMICQMLRCQKVDNKVGMDSTSEFVPAEASAYVAFQA